MDQLMAKVEEPTALTNPPEAVMDRIHFVVNNVTANNLPQKVCRPAVVRFPGQPMNTGLITVAQGVDRGLCHEMCRSAPAVIINKFIKLK